MRLFVLSLLRCLVFVGIVLSPVAAVADAAATKAQLAADVMALTTTDAIVETAQREVWPDIEHQIRAQNPDISAELIQTLKLMFERDMKAVFNAVAAQFSDVYAEAFTLSELAQLKAFYSSDVGQKVVRLQPEIGLKVVPAMMQHMDRAVPEAMARFFDNARSQGVHVGDLPNG